MGSSPHVHAVSTTHIVVLAHQQFGLRLRRQSLAQMLMLQYAIWVRAAALLLCAVRIIVAAAHPNSSATALYYLGCCGVYIHASHHAKVRGDACVYTHARHCI